MPGKLIAFIVVMLVIITFIGLNIDHSSSIRFWFGDGGILHDIPIFVSFFVMYLIGVLSVIPFLLFRKRRKPDRKDADALHVATESTEERPTKKSRILGGKKRKAQEQKNNAEEATENQE